MPRSGSAIRIGRLAGIPIGVHPLWLVVVALLTYALGHDYFPTEAPGLGETASYALGLACSLTLFAGVVLHELGHAIVARRRGLEVEEIDLWLLGGVARMSGRPRGPGDELRYALAGPAVTLVLLVAFTVMRLLAGGMPDALRAFVDYQIYVNGAILALNLLPAFPLDGGRVARSLLWLRSGDRDRATELAARLGRGFGMAMAFYGAINILAGSAAGFWFILLGGFLVIAADAERRAEAEERGLAAWTAAEVMTTPAATLGQELTLEGAVVVGFTRHLFSAFPVVGPDGATVGVLTIDEVRDVPVGERSARRVREVMTSDPMLLVEPSTRLDDIAQRPAFRSCGRVVVVDDAGRPEGIVSITDVQRRLRADELLPPVPAAPPRPLAGRPA